MSLVDEFSKINAYLFKYKPEVQKEYNDTMGVDDETHVGVIAQELLNNPITESVVETDGEYLDIDTAKLCTVLTAVCSDLAKEIVEIKQRLDNIEKGASYG